MTRHENSQIHALLRQNWGVEDIVIKLGCERIAVLFQIRKLREKGRLLALVRPDVET